MNSNFIVNLKSINSIKKNNDFNELEILSSQYILKRIKHDNKSFITMKKKLSISKYLDFIIDKNKKFTKQFRENEAILYRIELGKLGEIEKTEHEELFLKYILERVILDKKMHYKMNKDL